MNILDFLVAQGAQNRRYLLNLKRQLFGLLFFLHFILDLQECLNQFVHVDGAGIIAVNGLKGLANFLDLSVEQVLCKHIQQLVMELVDLMASVERQQHLRMDRIGDLSAPGTR